MSESTEYLPRGRHKDINDLKRSIDGTFETEIENDLKKYKEKILKRLAAHPLVFGDIQQIELLKELRWVKRELEVLDERGEI